MSAGAVVQAGTPEDVYVRPATEFAADFLGVGTRVPARVDAGTLVLGDTPLPQSRGSRYVAG